MNTPEFMMDDLEVPPKEVLATLGWSRGGRVSGRVRRQIEDATRGIQERIDYQFAYRGYPMRIEQGRVRVAEELVLRSTRLAQAVQACQRLFVYVVTLGPNVDAYIRYWMQRRPDFGVIVDAVASSAAESMVDRIEQYIGSHLPPALALSLPFSPGHCDWPVTEQQKIFELLPKRAAGVTLSPDLMMTPRKSVSGVFGVGPVSLVTQTENPCSSCARLECGHRRSPYSGSSNERIGHQRPVRPRGGRLHKLPIRPAPRG